MKVSKVVLIVVALHVLVIGGIFIFEGCSRAKSPSTEIAASDESAPADQSGANLPAVPADNTAAAQNLTPAAPTAVPAAATAKTYVVKKGDSLWKIAKAEGASIGDIARANNLSKTTALKVGQKLQIPAKAEPVVAQASAVPMSAGDAAAPATSATTPMDGNIYIVKTGDSLWKIARSQNVSVTAIKQANSLSSDSLKIGQKLRIPAASAATTPTAQAGIATGAANEWQPGPVTENGQQFHIVDIGETPAVIAKHYGIKVDDLLKANNISDARRIFVGQKLVIPVPATTPAAAAATGPTSPTASTAPVAAAPVVSAKN
jgi:peptidoglycan endopeptidase LytF